VAVVPPRYRVFLWAGPLIALGWLLIAVLDPDPPGRMGEYVGMGVFFGTMFGQTTLASTWVAFGPAPLVWRLPLSFFWVVMLAIAIGINLGLNGGPDEAVVVVGGCLLAQWFLVQLPLWGLAMGYGLRLRHRDEFGLGTDPSERQFGIRQLMIITAIVGVVFGIGRLVATNLGDRIKGGDEVAIFAFLAIAAIVITVPVLLASMMPRLALPATILALLLVGFATAWELPLLRTIGAGRGGGPDAMHFIWINVFTTAWILGIAVVVRLNGYRLATLGLGLAIHAKR
jgi:hypothetical protein